MALLEGCTSGNAIFFSFPSGENSPLKYVIMYLRTYVQIALLGFMLVACGKRPDKAAAWKPDPGMEIAETRDEYGYLSRFQQRPDGTREGPFEEYDTSGNLVQRAHYQNGQLEGKRVLFYTTGDTLTLETYRKGIFHGPWKTYYANGKVEVEGEYVNNTMTGIWRRYYDSGALMEEVTFSDNRENGPFVEYHRNGNLKAKGQYLDGDNEHGTLLLYDENGKLERRMECEKGICRTQWKAEEGP